MLVFGLIIFSARAIKLDKRYLEEKTHILVEHRHHWADAEHTGPRINLCDGISVLHWMAGDRKCDGEQGIPTCPQALQSMVAQTHPDIIASIEIRHPLLPEDLYSKTNSTIANEKYTNTIFVRNEFGTITNEGGKIIQPGFWQQGWRVAEVKVKEKRMGCDYFCVVALRLPGCNGECTEPWVSDLKDIAANTCTNVANLDKCSIAMGDWSLSLEKSENLFQSQSGFGFEGTPTGGPVDGTCCETWGLNVGQFGMRSHDHTVTNIKEASVCTIKIFPYPVVQIGTHNPLAMCIRPATAYVRPEEKDEMIIPPPDNRPNVNNISNIDESINACFDGISILHWTSECATDDEPISCAQSLSSMANEIHADIVGSIQVSNPEPLLGDEEDQYVQSQGDDPDISIFIRNGFATVSNSAGQKGWLVAEIQPEGLTAGCDYLCVAAFHEVSDWETVKQTVDSTCTNADIVKCSIATGDWKKSLRASERSFSSAFQGTANGRGTACCQTCTNVTGDGETAITEDHTITNIERSSVCNVKIFPHPRNGNTNNPVATCVRPDDPWLTSVQSLQKDYRHWYTDYDPHHKTDRAY